MKAICRRREEKGAGAVAVAGWGWQEPAPAGCGPDIFLSRRRAHALKRIG